MKISYTFAVSLLIIALLAVVACGPGTEAEAQSDDEPAASEEPASATLTTEDDKTLYALGQVMAQNLGAFALSEAEFATLTQGLTDGVLGRESQVDLQVFGPKIQTMAQGRVAKAAEKEKAAGAEFLTQKAAEADAVKTASGLVITELTAGTGASPAATDKVKVHYHGTLRDGTIFDSSVDRGEPVSFALNQVVPCWTEGLQLMKVGGKSRLVCPSDIAYGDQGRPPTIPPAATLVFEVELIEIESGS